MRRYPSLPLRGFKRSVKDASDMSHDPAEATLESNAPSFQDAAPKITGFNQHLRRLNV